jgi:hypothetical protein
MASKSRSSGCAACWTTNRVRRTADTRPLSAFFAAVTPAGLTGLARRVGPLGAGVVVRAFAGVDRLTCTGVAVRAARSLTTSPDPALELDECDGVFVAAAFGEVTA